MFRAVALCDALGACSSDRVRVTSALLSKRLAAIAEVWPPRSSWPTTGSGGVEVPVQRIRHRFAGPSSTSNGLAIPKLGPDGPVRVGLPSLPTG